jgi:hypothetical protein
MLAEQGVPPARLAASCDTRPSRATMPGQRRTGASRSGDPRTGAAPATRRSDRRARGLEAIFRAAQAADPAGAARRPRRDALWIAREALPRGSRCSVIAAGKAAPAMAAAFESAAAALELRGLAVTKDGHGRRLARLELREAGHPLPDARSEAPPAWRRRQTRRSSWLPGRVGAAATPLTGLARPRAATELPGAARRSRS